MRGSTTQTPENMVGDLPSAVYVFFHDGFSNIGKAKLCSSGWHRAWRSTSKQL